jgi:hypothetical protein
MQVNLSTIIGQWRPIAARLTEWNRAVPAFRHLHTVPSPDSDDDVLQHGHVIWGTLNGPMPMALCWEWAEVRLGVVVIFNPMNVLSNVRLLSEDGQPFSHGQTVLAFNSFVHEVNWQRGLCDELRFRRVAGKSVIPMTPRRRGNGSRPVRTMMSAEALAA